MPKPGYSDVILGTQYGDEGKARVVDEFANDFDIVARFNGGANAGHTIVKNGKKVALQQVPSGIFYEDKKMYIGSGCVVNVTKLVEELKRLKEAGFELDGRLHISSQAGLIQPHQILLDGHIGKSVGTTRNGIGPAYADRALRMWGDRLVNIRLCDFLYNPTQILKNIEENYRATCNSLGIEFSNLNLETLRNDFDTIAKYIQLDPLFLQRKVEAGGRVIFEGAQAFMLDVNKGSVPFVTSSSTSAAAAYTGGDLPPNFHRKTIGVAKAVMSRVGHGPFPSEFGGVQSEKYCMSFDENGQPVNSRDVEQKYNFDELLKSNDPFEMGKALRVASGEYGTVTKRPRRVGALDLIQLSYASRMNGVQDLILTKCDVLQYYSKTAKRMIPLVTGYKLNGEKINYVPSSTQAYSRVQPVIEYREAFTEDISSAKHKDRLPKAVLNLLDEIQEKTQCRIVGIGVGPERDQFVKLHS